MKCADGTEGQRKVVICAVTAIPPPPQASNPGALSELSPKPFRFFPSSLRAPGPRHCPFPPEVHPATSRSQFPRLSSDKPFSSDNRGVRQLTRACCGQIPRPLPGPNSSRPTRAAASPAPAPSAAPPGCLIPASTPGASPSAQPAWVLLHVLAALAAQTMPSSGWPQATERPRPPASLQWAPHRASTRGAREAGCPSIPVSPGTSGHWGHTSCPPRACVMAESARYSTETTHSSAEGHESFGEGREQVGL